jgi:hypothetical protein
MSLCHFASRRTVTLAVTLVVALVPTLVAQSACAQSAGAAATELFNSGRDLMKFGDYAGACPKLAESARLDAKVGTLARLAECEEKLGQMAAARGHWLQALNLASARGDDRRAHVQQELERVDAIVPKLRLSISGPAPRDLIVRIDDVVVGAGGLDVPLPLDPGRHVVTASAPGKMPWSREVQADAGGQLVAVPIPALGDAPSEAPSAPSAEPPKPASAAPQPVASRGASPLATAGLVTAAVGVVAIGIGAGFALSAKSKLDESNRQPDGCVGNDCPAAAAAIRNDARAAGDLATAFVVTGAALGAAGLGVFFFAPRSSVRAAARVGQDGAALSVWGTF